ncbi:hypothetical protein N9Y17_01200 [Gammaproteobacteria bacterium]|nr:hypothetical protein [Gammaproteobacteria bacterium]
MSKNFKDEMYERPHINALVDAFLGQENIKVYQSKFAKPKSNDSIFEDYYPCRLKKINKSELAVVQESIKKATTCALVSDEQNKYNIHYLGKDGKVLSKAVDENISAIVMSFDSDKNEIPFAVDKQGWFERIVGKEHQVKFGEKRTLDNKTFKTKKERVVSVLNPIKNDLHEGEAGNLQTVHLGSDISTIIKDWSWEIQQYFKENPSQEKTVTGLMPLCINQGHWVLLVIDIDKNQKCTLKIKDSMTSAEWSNKNLGNLKIALEKSLKGTKINPDLNQNISTVTFAAKDKSDPNIQQGNYCGGHVYRMMRDYIGYDDFFKTQKDDTKSHTVLREEDYNLIQQCNRNQTSNVSQENIDYFNNLYRFSTEAVVTKDYKEPSRFSDTIVSPSRQAELIPSFFRNQNVLKILNSLIVSADTSDSEGNEAAPTAEDSIRTQYFSNYQNTSQSALGKVLDAFNGNKGRDELDSQIENDQSDISSNQDTTKVTATLQNFSNRQIAYSNPSEMNADQFKQAVLLSVPTASSKGQIKLSAKSSNFGVLLCFAKAMGEINKASESQQPLALDFEKMKKSDGWKKAEQDFSMFDEENSFEDVLQSYADGEQVYKIQVSISTDGPSLRDIENLGDNALDFLADQNDLNESATSSFSCS